MSNENESAFPSHVLWSNKGMTKLEYFSLKIFCSFSLMFKEGAELEPLRKLATDQAKLLLKEIEESSK